jgi:xylulokinase
MKAPTILAVELGGSLFKACLFRGHRRVSSIYLSAVRTRVSGIEAEILPDEIDTSMKRLLAQFGKSLKEVDLVAICNESPALTVLSKKGKLLFPVITSLDRRSSEDSEWLLNTIGQSRWLHNIGNLPFPGGIAVSSLFWLSKHRNTIFKEASLFGCLNNYFQLAWTGESAIDSANASFMGLYDTCTLGGWNPELCALLKLEKVSLPPIKDAFEVAGEICTEQALSLGFRAGIPMLVGTMDTSASAMAVGLKEGEILHLSGSTDVIATITSKPNPSDQYLTRGLGWGKQWVTARPIAPAGITLKWCEDIFGKEVLRHFQRNFEKKPFLPPVSFDPYLIGDRLSLWPKTATFKKLIFGTTKEEMMGAVLTALRDDSLEGMRTLMKTLSLSGKVFYSASNKTFADWLHAHWKREWKKDWVFQNENELPLNGLNALAQRYLEKRQSLRGRESEAIA